MSRQSGQARSARAASRPQAIWWISFGLIALAVVVFWQALSFGLVNWDDPLYITENPHVRTGLSFANAVWSLTAARPVYWHPLTWLTHQLDVQMFGDDARGYHLTNLILHVANTLLVFLGLRRVTGNLPRSACVAAIFAVHPLHVESVAWVTERKDVLSAFFELATIGAYARYVALPSARRYGLVLLLFALALTSKPMVVTLPVLLLLVDYWPLRRAAPWRSLVMEKAPMLAMSLAVGLLTIVLQRQVGAAATMAALPWTTRVANTVTGYADYVARTVWPAHLAAFYPIHAPNWAWVAAAAVMLLAVTAVLVAWRGTRPGLLVGWLWFLVALAPVTGLLQTGEQATADRFMYVPILGLLVMCSEGVGELLQRWRLSPRVAGVTVVAIVLATSVVARAQVSTWSDSRTLWQHAIAAGQASHVAHEKLGDALRDAGDLDGARAQYEAAIAAAPPNSPVYEAVIRNDLGMVAELGGRNDDGLREFAIAVARDATFAEAQLNLGNALGAAGRLSEALEHLIAAVRLNPAAADAHLGLGNVMLQQGRAPEALQAYRDALTLAPSMAQAHSGLAGALLTLGRGPEAEAAFTEALRLDPRLVNAHVNLALLLARRGDVAQARRHLADALSLDPNNGPARELMKALGIS